MTQMDRRTFAQGMAGTVGALAAAPLLAADPGLRSRGPAAPSFAAQPADPLPRQGWQFLRPIVRSVRGGGGMISSTRGGRPMADALDVLRAGGNAADAALGMALGQIAYALGTWTTYAGITTLLYYDAASGRSASLDGSWRTVSDETEPMSIPDLTIFDANIPSESGRTVLVPGTMRTIEAAHARFGTLPFARLFDSAIGIAERGMTVDAGLERVLARPIRLPDTAPWRRRADGSPLRVGDVLKQPELAATLRAVAANGADHMYTGAWARRFVDAVRADGGRMTMADMSGYRPEWGEPLHSRYHGVDIHTLHNCHFVHGGLRLAQRGGLAAMGRYYEDPKVFQLYHRIFRATGTNMIIVGDRIDEQTVPATDWIDERKIAEVWPLVRDGRFPDAPSGRNHPHTDCITVVDARGNVASLIHSANGAVTGRYVDGISVAGPAGMMQNYVRRVGPGRAMTMMLPNLIATKGGKPVFATSAAGTAMHQETIKVVINLVDYGKAGREAVQAPAFLEPFFTPSTIDREEAVLAGDYTPELLDEVRALGTPVVEVGFGGAGGANINTEARRPDPNAATPATAPAAAAKDKWHQQPGFSAVALIVIDPISGEREGVSPRMLGDARPA